MTAPVIPRSCEIQVRFGDLDAYGHVNNAVFFTYLETARTRLFLEPFLALGKRQLLLLVVRAECDYLKPIELADRVVIDLDFPKIGRSSFDVAYTVHNGDGTVFARARTVMVCYDARHATPVAVPEELIAALA